MWDKITYPFLNFSGCAVAVWKWISNFIPQFTGHMSFPSWIKVKPCLLKGFPGRSIRLPEYQWSRQRISLHVLQFHNKWWFIHSVIKYCNTILILMNMWYHDVSHNLLIAHRVFINIYSHLLVFNFFKGLQSKCDGPSMFFATFTTKQIMNTSFSSARQRWKWLAPIQCNN